MDHSDPNRIKYFEKLLTQILFQLCFRSPPTPCPLIPLDPFRGALWGARVALNEGGDLMSMTPKCNMFLESLRADQTFHGHGRPF